MVLLLQSTKLLIQICRMRSSTAIGTLDLLLSSVPRHSVKPQLRVIQFISYTLYLSSARETSNGRNKVDQIRNSSLAHQRSVQESEIRGKGHQTFCNQLSKQLSQMDIWSTRNAVLYTFRTPMYLLTVAPVFHIRSLPLQCLVSWTTGWFYSIKQFK